MGNTAACYPPPLGSIHNPQYPYYQAPLTHAPPTGAAQPPPMMVVPQPQPFNRHHHQPPFAPYAPQSYDPLASYDEVRRLFIAGLPADVRPREIDNLFREFPGYEPSRLLAPFADIPPFAFAVFLDQQSAFAAMHALNGLVFDLEKNYTLYIDLAKFNSSSKCSRIDNERLASEEDKMIYNIFKGQS